MIFKNLSLEDLPGEKWRQVVGFPQYEVSNLSRIKSNVRRPRILKQTMNYRGYLYVSLFKNWEKKYIKTHQVVAITFLNLVNGKTEVNHIDSDKLNNRPENLEWCNRSENMRHMIQSTGPGHRTGITNPKATIVVHNEYGIFCTCRDAAFISGVKEQNFNNMLYEVGYRKNRTKFILT